MPNPIDGIRPSWIAFGWFLAAALTALALLALVALDVISADPSEDAAWTAAAFVAGFGVAGFLVGVRVGAAPVVHGLGIGAFSVLVWFGANLLLGEPTEQTAWSGLGAGSVAALLLLQTVAAVVGARIGVRNTTRPRT